MFIVHAGAPLWRELGNRIGSSGTETGKSGYTATGQIQRGLAVKDVTWINASGMEMRPKEWDDSNMHCFGMLMDGRAQPPGTCPGEDTTLPLVLNAHHDFVEFTLPETASGREWSLLVDTNLAEQAEPERFATGDNYGVPGRSVLLFALRPEASS